MSRENFATNLMRMMEQQGLNNSRLSRLLGVSRESVRQWISGKTLPSPFSMAALCVVLGCTEADLTTAEPTQPTVLTLTAWAHREGISVTRARDLFSLRILTGASHTPYTILVPIELQVPEDSKTLVRTAKYRRPAWVAVFHDNFPRLVRESKINYTEISEKTGVRPTAVSHWANRRNYPQRDRLPVIAEALGVTMQELIGTVRL